MGDGRNAVQDTLHVMLTIKTRGAITQEVLVDGLGMFLHDLRAGNTLARSCVRDRCGGLTSQRWLQPGRHF